MLTMKTLISFLLVIAALTQVDAGKMNGKGKGKGKGMSSYKGKGKGKGHYYYYDYYYDYVTLKITNLSYLQPFSGIFVAIHNEHAPPLFTLGEPASPELARLAEDGDPMPLVDLYNTLPGVGAAYAFTEDAPYLGGETVYVDIPVDPYYPYVTVGTMAINTNDAFVAINAKMLVPGDVFTGVGYDAGSEENNESCSSIPGPACATIDTANAQSGGGEGFVHVHRGIYGVGDLDPSLYDWRNPMVRFEVL